MKLMQTSLCVRKDIGSSFHQCAGLVKLVHASLLERIQKTVFTTVEVLTSSCLSVRRDLEYSCTSFTGPPQW